MINFDYSQEQQDLKREALKFSLQEISPIAHKHDESAEFPMALLQKAWELGFINTCIPEAYGGSGFTLQDSIIISESLAYGCMGINTIIMANDLALLPIVIGGSEEQKKRFLIPFNESYKIASFCLTEPENGSDAAGIKTTFKENGDHYLLNGNKMWITNAGFADLFVVYGTIGTEHGRKGIMTGVLTKEMKGIEIGKPEKKMGHRCSDTRAITFNNVVVPKENILALPGQGWDLAMKTLNHSRPLVASSAVGGAQRALDHAKQYARERKQFNKPLKDFQMIQHMIADMEIRVENSRNLVTKAAWLSDQKKDNKVLASMAKAYAADSCMKVATDAVQIYGGYGYSTEYPVEKIMRDAKLIQIYEGTSQIQRLVIARESFSE